MVLSASALLFTLFYALPFLAITGPVGVQKGIVRRSMTFKIVGAIIAAVAHSYLFLMIVLL